MKYLLIYCLSAFAVFSCERDSEPLTGAPTSSVPDRITDIVENIREDRDEQEVTVSPSDFELFDQLLRERLSQDGIAQVDPTALPYLPAPTRDRTSSKPTDPCSTCADELPQTREALQQLADDHCLPYYRLVPCCAKNDNARYLLVISKPGC